MSCNVPVPLLTISYSIFECHPCNSFEIFSYSMAWHFIDQVYFDSIYICILRTYFLANVNIFSLFFHVYWHYIAC
ncbi:hypothetical protein Patl1_04498 [Pistacia atlantica]|uniref:Uncharacterized protein n=1 Tax=Pistacia atlantica TaxID=434234 RepID=A0ACC1BRF7_9ROSI|nr:hypothetical protein Patl1_04498 [Pistacia atlantica]